MNVIYEILALAGAGATIYFAVYSREYRKFLSGAFVVSGGIQLYLSFAHVSVPLMGTGFVQTPELSATRGALHFLLGVLCLYFGFIRKPEAR